MIVKGGYIKDTNSVRVHPVKNVIIKNSKNWSRVTIKGLNDAVTVCNIGFNYVIKIVGNTNDIVLVINEKEYFRQSQLFEFEVEIDTDNLTDIEIKDDFIYEN